jgi:hypothetical protein
MRLASYNSLENWRRHLDEAKGINGKIQYYRPFSGQDAAKVSTIDPCWLPIGTDTENPEAFDENSGLAILNLVE